MIIDILENLEKAGSITLAEKNELINQYEYLRGRNITIKYDDDIHIINQIRKTYWNNITFEDWFKPKYYITECERESNRLTDMIVAVNENDNLRYSQGYEILTRNQSVDEYGALVIITTYKRNESYKEYKKEQDYKFRCERANELEKAGAVFNLVTCKWEI